MIITNETNGVTDSRNKKKSAEALRNAYQVDKNYWFDYVSVLKQAHDVKSEIQLYDCLTDMSLSGNTNAMIELSRLYIDKNRRINDINQAIYWAKHHKVDRSGV